MAIGVYTDGSSLGNGTASASAGWGVYWDDGPNRHLNCSGPVYQGKPTNNRAELYAIDTVMDQILNLNNRYDFHIYTDSQYCKNALSSWAARWQANGWVSSGNRPVKNKGLIKDILRKMQKARSIGHGITLVYVPAHQGYYGNEQADRLAQNAANGYYIDEGDYSNQDSDSDSY